ncbi:MAG: tRNA nucleotidyltransferase [Solirubrobacterales bacterium]|nr:tRNA nucleotidyltransferase [Solirubrobacterales bacterium]
MRTPAEALEALRALPCGERLLRAFGPGDGVHLVGGAVRDLLLGRVPRELDLVVEGDVDDAAARLPGDLRAHDRFGTAIVQAGSCRFDLARARTETYASPGALPDVRPAGLAEDLRRRDVTVNAIALGLGGTLESVPGALGDLAAGVLRVLHDASFTDDPTRLWRVARYAARLGFAVEPHTRALAAAADPSTVSGDRLGAELRLALAEPDPPGALRAALELNPRLLPDGFAVRDDAIAAALALLPPEGRRDLVVLAACTAGMNVRELLAWLDAMSFPAGDRDVVAAASRAGVGAPLRAARTNAEIARAARGAPVEAVALTGGENARRWIHDLRHVRLDITGDDLLAAGVPEGPELGERLRRALERKLDGELDGRDAELAAALE